MLVEKGSTITRPVAGCCVCYTEYPTRNAHAITSVGIYVLRKHNDEYVQVYFCPKHMPKNIDAHYADNCIPEYHNIVDPIVLEDQLEIQKQINALNSDCKEDVNVIVNNCDGSNNLMSIVSSRGNKETVDMYVEAVKSKTLGIECKNQIVRLSLRFGNKYMIDQLDRINFIDSIDIGRRKRGRRTMNMLRKKK